MITKKSAKEIEILREGGGRLAYILNEVVKKITPGVSTQELDDFAKNLAEAGGDKPAFLHYKPYGARRPYPATLCVSINDEVVHGIPNEERRVIEDGDIVSLDMGLIHQSLFTDMALSVAVGEVDEAGKELIGVTWRALYQGIGAARSGARVGDISHAIESFVRPFGYGIVEELSGHGVGFSVHEDPYVPNFGKSGTGEALESGMVLAIEPMINEGTKKVYVDRDGYTVRTADGKRSAHFEHTVLITEGEPEVLTKLNSAV
ncbi:MAG: type I methionyl aminopeptidase [Candidatus Taylorbacteria bacterium]|nr:type I methionyl aminopeptidase [Candidatus Taylorbacteria bacterium]